MVAIDKCMLRKLAFIVLTVGSLFYCIFLCEFSNVCILKLERDGFKTLCMSISKEVTHAACIISRAEIPPDCLLSTFGSASLGCIEQRCRHVQHRKFLTLQHPVHLSVTPCPCGQHYRGDSFLSDSHKIQILWN